MPSTRTGEARLWCRKISPGCAHCYAEDLNDSDYFHGNHLPYAGEAPVLKLREDVIDSWARQRKPKKHFVMSMSDVFGEWVPRAWIFRFLDGMRAAARQIFQVLTKRADVMLREVRAWLEARGLGRAPDEHLARRLGRKSEVRRRAIPLLLQIPVAARFLSAERPIGPVDLTDIVVPSETPGETHIDALCCDVDVDDDEPFRGATIAWVIVGGESGSEARPMHPQWARSLRNQCVAAGVAFFFKQHGGGSVSTTWSVSRCRCQRSPIRVTTSASIPFAMTRIATACTVARRLSIASARRGPAGYSMVLSGTSSLVMSWRARHESAHSPSTERHAARDRREAARSA